jgi:hypothetical protein
LTGELSETSLAAPTVKSGFDPCDNSDAKFFSRFTLFVVEHILLQHGVERAHGGVITHGPWSRAIRSS